MYQVQIESLCYMVSFPVWKNSVLA